MSYGTARPYPPQRFCKFVNPPQCCVRVRVLQGVSVSVSVMTLTAISVERYYAICYPLRFKATLSRARATIAVVWIISACILLPEVIVLDTLRPPKFAPDLPTDLLTSCKPTWDYPYQVFPGVTVVLFSSSSAISSRR